MADAVSWGSWAYVQKSSTNWSADALADTAIETSDAISLDDCIAAEIGITLVEDNTGAIDGDVTVHILREAGTTPVYEEPNQGSPLTVLITPVQNDTIRKAFTLDAHSISGCKIAVENQAGQELTVTVEIRKATWDTV